MNKVFRLLTSTKTTFLLISILVVEVLSCVKYKTAQDKSFKAISKTKPRSLFLQENEIERKCRHCCDTLVVLSNTILLFRK